MASLFQRMKKNASGLYRDPLKEQSHKMLLHLFFFCAVCGSGSETFSRIQIKIRKISFRIQARIRIH